MTTFLTKGQRVQHAKLGKGTFEEFCWEDNTSYVTFDMDSDAEGETLRVTTSLLKPISETVIHPLMLLGKESIQVAFDPSEGIHSIALLTEQGMEWKAISPELYSLLVSELTAQKGAVHGN